MRAFAAIGCTEAKTGNVGSFIYTEKSPEGNAIAISPVFGHCIELFDWLRGNGWNEVNEHPKSHPVGTYEKLAS